MQFGENISYILTGLGWLIAVACILRKYRWKNGAFTCFLSDIVTATFASITLVLVVNFSFSLYIDLKEEQEVNSKLGQDMASQQRSFEELQDQYSLLSAELETLKSRNRRLASENVELRQLAESSANTLIEDLRAIWNLHQGERLETRSTIDKHFGNNEVFALNSLSFYFFANNFVISCLLEGEDVYCEQEDD